MSKLNYFSYVLSYLVISLTQVGGFLVSSVSYRLLVAWLTFANCVWFGDGKYRRLFQFKFTMHKDYTGRAYKLFKSGCTSRPVFVVISLSNVLSTCGTASHHLFAFLLCHLSDEQFVMSMHLVMFVIWKYVSLFYGQLLMSLRPYRPALILHSGFFIYILRANKMNEWNDNPVHISKAYPASTKRITANISGNIIFWNRGFLLSDVYSL